MTLRLYYAPMSSASPVHWALAELDVPHELSRVDLSSDTHKQPEYLALNPMGQVPTLLEGEQAMFESSACLIYLGQTYGIKRDLWPAAGTPEQMRALTWVAWTAVTAGGNLRQIFATGGDHLPPEQHNAAAHQQAKLRFGELMRIVDAHVAAHEYVTGRFSLADCYVAAALGWSTGVVGHAMDQTPGLAAYVQRCMARPAAAVMNPEG